MLSLAREYGAAVICLLIDEEGQARDVEWKLRVAHRIHDLAVERYGLEPTDLIFDALTFPLVDRRRRPARATRMETIEAIRRIKAELPGASTDPRPVERVASASSPRPATSSTACSCTSACEAGLDAAIVHAARIMPLNRIPDEQREVCLDLIYDRRDADDYDPLHRAARRCSRDVEARRRSRRRTAPAGRSRSG